MPHTAFGMNARFTKLGHRCSGNRFPRPGVGQPEGCSPLGLLGDETLNDVVGVLLRLMLAPTRFERKASRWRHSSERSLLTDIHQRERRRGHFVVHGYRRLDHHIGLHTVDECEPVCQDRKPLKQRVEWIV